MNTSACSSSAIGMTPEAWKMSWIPLDPWLLLISFLGSWAVLYIKYKHSYWTLRGIPGPRPLLLSGNMHSRLTHNQQELAISWTQSYGKFYGTYMGFTPWLAVVDHRLIKQILVTDFIHFPDRIKTNCYHELWNQNLLFANTDSWKRIRTLTTPAFTSAKLRLMQPLMERSVGKLVKYLHRVIKAGSGQAMVNIKEVIIGFSIDVIASTSFATETDANSETREKQSPIVANVRTIFELPLWKVGAGFLLPRWILKILGVDSFFNPAPFSFLINLTRHIIRERKASGSKRNDLLQLLIDAKVDEKTLAEADVECLEAGEEKNEQSKLSASPTSKSGPAKMLTESEIIAQGIFFFSAGFETTSSTLVHCLFELAHHPEIQERLYGEIVTTLAPFKTDESHQSQEYYEMVISGIAYLDAVLKETLRRYPPVLQVLRICATDGYNLGGVELFKGQSIEIPVAAVHYCPEYYPEPECFNPERFMPANRDKLVPCTFLPFGAGPRNCIGLRFTYQEMKMCLVEVVQQFKFNLTPRTPARLSFKAGSPVLSAGEFPLMVTQREV